MSKGHDLLLQDFQGCLEMSTFSNYYTMLNEKILIFYLVYYELVLRLAITKNKVYAE